MTRHDNAKVARDVMNPHVVAVSPDATVRHAASLLAERQITGAPVVEADGRLVGVVSVTDIAESDAESSDVREDTSDPRRPLRGWDEATAAEEIRGLHVEEQPLLVRDIMTPTVYTVPEETTVSRIARAMIAGRIHRVFVTRQGRIVGIVTSLDLLKILAEE
jgi:CBS domain-containing protein